MLLNIFGVGSGKRLFFGLRLARPNTENYLLEPKNFVSHVVITLQMEQPCVVDRCSSILNINIVVNFTLYSLFFFANPMYNSFCCLRQQEKHGA